MYLNSVLNADSNKDKLNLSLSIEKIELLKNIVFNGFLGYDQIIKQYRPDLYIDKRYKDEICNYIDLIFINIIKKQIPIFGARELREHQIIKALQVDDFRQLAYIIASAARSAVAFIPTINHAIVDYYNNYSDEYYENEIEDNELIIEEQLKIIKTKKVGQYQIVLLF